MRAAYRNTSPEVSASSPLFRLPPHRPTVQVMAVCRIPPLLVLAFALALPGAASAQVSPESLDSLRAEADLRASRVQGGMTRADNAATEAIARYEAGDTTGLGALLRSLRTGVRSARTNNDVLRAMLRGLVLDTTPTPDTSHAHPQPDTTQAPPVEQPDTIPAPREWDRVLSDTSVIGDVVVTPGERWLIGANVRIAGNLRCDSGLVGMRPGSSLTFASAPPSQYVGGGMRFNDAFSGDWGAWIGGTCRLDIRGTPKTGWTRSGMASDWLSTDELWVAPTARGDFTPRRWFPGDSIPQVDERVPPAEVVNVTRDVSVTGGHFHISSSVPSRIEYVTLRGMGILKPRLGENSPTTGRYALHFHFQGNGSRGTVVRGVAAIDTKSRVYVPHASHGITFEDVVSVNSGAEAFWWDNHDRTQDVSVDRLAALGTYVSRETVGATPRFSCVILNGGDRMRITNSVCAGTRGGSSSHGFDWPSNADNTGNAVWHFEGNVAHNNEGAGIRLWFNDNDPHVMRDYVTYRNEGAGVENGAYGNAHHYTDGLSLDRMIWHSGGRAVTASDALSAEMPELTGLIAGGRNVHVEAERGSPLTFGVFNKPTNPSIPITFEDCTFLALDGVSPLVLIDQPKIANQFHLVFRNCNVRPEDVRFAVFPAPVLASTIRLENADGSGWLLTPREGEPNGHVAAPLPAVEVAP